MSILDLYKWRKRCIAIASDIAMTAVALLTTEWLSTILLFQKINLSSLVLMIAIQCFMYLVCGLYRGIWRFASIPDLFRILRAVLMGVSTIFIFLTYAELILPIKIYITYSLLLIILLSAPRLLYRSLHDRNFNKQGKRVLVVGAGSAGEVIMRDLCRASYNTKLLPIGFVDDDPTRLGCEIHGVRVLGDCSAIPHLVNKLNVELILIAIPSASSKRMREIVSFCAQAKVEFRTLPGLKDITDGNVSINSIREVLIEDLLGREQVVLDWEGIKQSIDNKIILVTGGGGSIGAELCRQICDFSPRHLIIIDNNEFNLYTIDLELRKKTNNIKLSIHLCNVTDHIETAKIFAIYQPELVFHVAAYKHVPLLENHLRLAMYNNIIGTRNVAELSNTHHVQTFVLISTDKAVNPTNIMGATKRAAEVFCQNYNLHSSTQFITVRFGNVLNSTGSVIPLFRKQLLQGGPLTVTHRDISRYFMTIPEAAQLILQAITMNKNGEIFVLDMGTPINISYLAEQMIRLSGKTLGKDIDIEYIGLRPGEKLHEELFHKSEDIYETSHPKIKRASVRLCDWSTLKKLIEEIELSFHINDEKKLRELLYELVPEYHETQKNIDKHYKFTDIDKLPIEL